MRDESRRSKSKENLLEAKSPMLAIQGKRLRPLIESPASQPTCTQCAKLPRITTGTTISVGSQDYFLFWMAWEKQ